MWKTWHARLKTMVGRTVQVELAAAVEETVRLNERRPDYHVSRGQVGHWLNGKRDPRLFEFFALCQVVGADPGEVLFGQRVLQNNLRPGSATARALAHTAAEPPPAVYARGEKIRAFKSKQRRARRLLAR